MIPHTANYAPLVFSHIMIPIETLLFIFLRPYEVHDEISIDYITLLTDQTRTEYPSKLHSGCCSCLEEPFPCLAVTTSGDGRVLSWEFPIFWPPKSKRRDPRNCLFGVCGEYTCYRALARRCMLELLESDRKAQNILIIMYFERENARRGAIY